MPPHSRVIFLYIVRSMAVYQSLADHEGVPQVLISCSMASGERDASRDM